MNLSNRQNTVVLHYGCADFNKSVHTIFWIGAIYYDNQVKKYFFWKRKREGYNWTVQKFLRQPSRENICSLVNEFSVIWFNPIQNRYKELTGKNISITPRLQIDLSEYLKEKYGIEYISRQGVRFNNLAKLNGFSRIKLDLEVKNTVRRNSKIRINILNIPSRKTWSVKDFRLKL